MKMILAVTMYSLCFCAFAQQNDTALYKNYHIKIGIKWFDADAKVSAADMKAGIPSELQSKTNPSKNIPIQKFHWWVDLNGFGAKNFGTPLFDYLSSGTIIMLEDIVIDTAKGGNQYPYYFRLHMK